MTLRICRRNLKVISAHHRLKEGITITGRDHVTGRVGALQIENSMGGKHLVFGQFELRRMKIPTRSLSTDVSNFFLAIALLFNVANRYEWTDEG